MCTKWSIEYAQIVTNMQQLVHLCIRDVNARACLVTPPLPRPPQPHATGKAGRLRTRLKPARAALPKPKPATTPQPKAQPAPKPTAQQPPKPAATPRPHRVAKPKPKPKPGAKPAAHTQPPADVLYDLQPLPPRARQQYRPARRPPAMTNTAATGFIAPWPKRDALHPNTTLARKPGPQATPRARVAAAPGAIKSVPNPLPAPDVCPRPADAPLLPPPWTRTQPSGRVRIHVSAYARAPPTHCAPTRLGTTRAPRGPPPPPVSMTPPRAPTPKPTPKATNPPVDRGGSAGPTRSCGSCGTWHGRRPPSRAWYAGPAGRGKRIVDSSWRGIGCRRTHRKLC